MVGFRLAATEQFNLVAITDSFPLQYDTSYGQLAGFLQPFPAGFDPTNMSYLRMKGALDIPRTHVQEALIRAYVEYVHPFLPILDLGNLFTILGDQSGSNGRISLLLYQAILSAGSSFVDCKCLYEEGFQSRREARKFFLRNTKMLYDFDYESDRLILVQSILLMTYWYDHPDDQQDSWYWIGIAVSLAHTIGLHSYRRYLGLAPAEQHRWKRIWWACYMRDCLISLGTKKPRRIGDEDFDIPMLQEHDFEIGTVSLVGSSLTYGQFEVLQNTHLQRDLAVMCILKARLCVILGRILGTQYTLSIGQAGVAEGAGRVPYMKRRSEMTTILNEASIELGAWTYSLPDSCRYRTVTHLDMRGSGAILALHRALLGMLCCTVTSILYRFGRASLLSQPLPGTLTALVTCRTRVREAVTQTIQMGRELQRHGLIRFLPSTSITIFLITTTLYVLEGNKSEVGVYGEDGFDGLQTCKEIVEELCETHVAGEAGSEWFNLILRRAG
ncbi:hypothetical protein MRS44_011999 [Fusarium solani]|uniref:uncharacterized protein n=1 Tax=Fusarium solani TaxID=169388 RepID=UPI0032C4AB68|nr:hypothetical protein MRS44_011999 [Fusarium solani]